MGVGKSVSLCVSMSVHGVGMSVNVCECGGGHECERVCV